MQLQLTGLHHISAFTAEAERNVDFFTRVLGLRLVKKTVNQDDTSSYHLFYGDERGNPGTEVTFFDIPYAAPTKPGSGSIARVGLRVPDRQAFAFWQERFAELGVDHDPVTSQGTRKVLPFRDFEGQRLLLIADDGDEATPGGVPWELSPVPVRWAIRGLGPVTLVVAELRLTAQVLTEVLGFRQAGTYVDTRFDGAGDAEAVVFATGAGGPGAEVHVVERRNLPPERLGRGGVHHVAFRIPDREQQRLWLGRLRAIGIPNSGIVDRYYFSSIYFREPNGILFELATDGPGFTVDEDFATLGTTLALPPFLEPERPRIEARLRPLHLKIQV